MKLQLTSTQREEAIRAVMGLFQQYAEQPSEHAVTRALMFVTSDLMELRQERNAPPAQNLPKIITQNNPGQSRYTVMVSATMPPAAPDDEIGFFHSDSLIKAQQHFQKQVGQVKAGWVSLWDNHCRKMLGEIQIGGDPK